VKLVELGRRGRECLKDEINELETNSKHKNIRGLYRRIHGFEKGCF
jgi:hypothetical protein